MHLLECDSLFVAMLTWNSGLAAVLGPHVEILVTTKPVHPGPGRGGDEATAGIVGAHACDRDASLLRSQLEP